MDSLGGIFKIPELKRKLVITLMILFFYRMGTYITIPGIDVDAINRIFEHIRQEQGGMSRLMGMANMFTGGAMSKAAVFSLGIMPYITASILFQILSSVYPSLKKLQKDGESGRKKINQYTRYAAVVICLFQSFMLCRLLPQAFGESNIVTNPGPMFVFSGMVCLTTGTMIVMWLGEMITEFGLGNGISIIIMAGILAELPVGVMQFAGQLSDESGSGYLTLFFLVGFFVLVTIAIVYTTLGQRRVPIRQHRRAGGGDGLRQYLPLKVNMAGVIPIIFAQSLMMFPAFLSQLPALAFLQNYFQPGQASWMIPYLSLIIFFCFFYTSMMFNPVEMAENMKQGGTFIPGVRPGQETSAFLELLLVRLTVVGATVLAVIAIVPNFLYSAFDINYVLAGIFGGTGLLIVVGVTLDLLQKIEGYMLSHNFDALLARGRLRST